MESSFLIQTPKIGVYGIGYVGLPLAVAFGKTEWAPVVGVTRSQWRVDALVGGEDPDGELTPEQLRSARIRYTTDASALNEANFIIVAVPTPITQAKQPDLTPVKEASQAVGSQMRSGTTVVFESTVYPGVTEDICIPIMEKASGLKCGVDWFIGYSPERVNPGDKEHTIETIVKVVSGMDAPTLERVARVYGRICRAGVHKASTIKVAEAEKVIENIQRDLNIALFNELALIFEKMGINSQEVFDAASTKWNFHRYHPGLVGGHCIGVDPYYLTYRAQELGYHPEVILAGRRINDSMAAHVAGLMVKGLIRTGKQVQNSNVLMMGLTFKANVKDTRNSKAWDVIASLKEYGVNVVAYDPLLTPEHVQEEFGVLGFKALQDIPRVDGITMCAAHDVFKQMSKEQYQYILHNPGCMVDVTGGIPGKQYFQNTGIEYVRL